MVRSLAVLSSALAIVAAGACDDKNSPSTSSTTTSSTGSGGIGGSGAGGASVMPGEAAVLTCSTQQFTASGPMDGSWSVTPAEGTIDEKGLYTAPIKVPSPADVTVSYASASATVHLATAHPSKEVELLQGVPVPSVPLEHSFVASGKRVYAAVPDVASPQAIQLAKSDDGGTTFAPLTPFTATGTVTCVSAAIDAGNADVVYLVYRASDPVHDYVHLAVSEDGGKTFPATKEYVLGDSILGGLGMFCPDVASTSPDHVVVSSARFSPDDVAHWAGLYPDGKRGAGFGTGMGDDALNYYSKSDVNTGTSTGCPVEENGGEKSPRIVADGKGHACVAYVQNAAALCDDAAESVLVQCSSDDGKTWSKPKALGKSGSSLVATIAIAPSGNVAIAWVDGTTGIDEIAIAISSDAGATFGAPSTYPLDRAGLGGPSTYTAEPVVAWDGDVLWLEQTLDRSDAPRILIDKSCDLGKTWSGALVVTPPSEHTSGPLFATTEGVRVAGFGIGNGTAKPTVAIALTP